MKYVNLQKAEADNLRQKASAAINTAVQAEANAATRLETCLNKEHAQASKDQHNLLAQITSLVHMSDKVRNTR